MGDRPAKARGEARASDGNGPREHAGGFRRAAIGTTWVWLLVFALVPNLLVVAVSLLERGEHEFVHLALSTASYVRLLDPLYAGVFWSSFRLAAIATLVCLLIAYPFALVPGFLKSGNLPS